jgi:hypothetical protein
MERKMETNRRCFMTTTAIAALGVGAASCGTTPIDISGFVQQFIALVQQIQQGVRTALQKACMIATTSLVPDVNTALAAIEQVLNATLGSGNIGAVTAQQIANAVNIIVAFGCPPAPSGVAALGNTIKRPNGQVVPVVFIK